MKKQQQGLSLIDMLMATVVGAIIFLTLFKVLPPINEYNSIQKAVDTIADEGNRNKQLSAAMVRRSFDKHANINNIVTITGKDLTVQRLKGKMIIEAEYERRVGLVGNMGLYFDFHVQSSRE